MDAHRLVLFACAACRGPLEVACPPAESETIKGAMPWALDAHRDEAGHPCLTVTVHALAGRFTELRHHA